MSRNKRIIKLKNLIEEEWRKKWWDFILNFEYKHSFFWSFISKSNYLTIDLLKNINKP